MGDVRIATPEESDKALNPTQNKLVEQLYFEVTQVETPFTLSGIDSEIRVLNNNIVSLQARIDKLNAKKDKAALVKGIK